MPPTTYLNTAYPIARLLNTALALSVLLPFLLHCSFFLWAFDTTPVHGLHFNIIFMIPNQLSRLLSICIFLRERPSMVHLLYARCHCVSSCGLLGTGPLLLQLSSFSMECQSKKRKQRNRVKLDMLKWSREASHVVRTCFHVWSFAFFLSSFHRSPLTASILHTQYDMYYCSPQLPGDSLE